MNFKKIFKFVIGVPLVCLGFFTLLLIEEGSLGILNSTFSCDSKLDHEQFRVCVQNIYETDNPGNENYWYAGVSLGERIFPGVYRYRGGSPSPDRKFTFGSHASAQLQVRMSAPPIVEVLIDTNEVAKFKVPEDFVSH